MVVLDDSMGNMSMAVLDDRTGERVNGSVCSLETRINASNDDTLTV